MVSSVSMGLGEKLKKIKRADLERAWDVNDALSQEMRELEGDYSGSPVQDLGVDVDDLAEFASAYAISREADVKKNVVFQTSLTFSMGAITALRARKLIDT
jgi:hypothetical protein